jgi:hypothetical protein
MARYSLLVVIALHQGRGTCEIYDPLANTFKPAADKNVTVKASDFNKSPQLSTNGSQQVQYQSITNSKFQQV